MTWAKIDDSWWSHPKVIDLSLAASGLWARALSWSCQQRRDTIPPRFLSMVGADYEHADELVDAGLWHELEDGRGWRIHEWSDYFQADDRRRKIPAAIRRWIYERDGNACLHCGRPDRLSLDHVKPRACGGTDSVSNLQTLCVPCNSRKGEAWEVA